MCKRNLLTAIRSISYTIFFLTSISFTIISINQTISDLSASKSRNFTIGGSRSPLPLHESFKKLNAKRVIRSQLTRTIRILRCPGEMRTGYCIIRNYYRAKTLTGYNESVTLTTQGTVKFLKHAEELCKRWQGPVSVAVYAPGDDFQQAKNEIFRLRNCGDPCVEKWVTWHFVFDAMHQPSSKLLVPIKSSRTSVVCSNINPLKASYIDSHNLVYPINVARNVARLTASTFYVFASDIELYPSRGIIPRFLKMVRQLASNSTSQIKLSRKHVFVFRVFEVDEKVKTVPNAKEELAKLYDKNLAIFFHRYMCSTCHNIPNLQKWMNAATNGNELTISMTTKRERRYGLQDWEPFFIGTNADPLFDERMTWNGKANKMQVAFELCLMNYDLHILDDAFLVHVPGIKKFSFEKQKPRVPYMRKNKATFLTITKELRKKYVNRTECS